MCRSWRKWMLALASYFSVRSWLQEAKQLCKACALDYSNIKTIYILELPNFLKYLHMLQKQLRS